MSFRLRGVSPVAVAAAALAVWLAAVALGFHSLLAYSYAPGVLERAADVWPAGVAPPDAPHTPLLVMFLHPQCACSRASISELAVLIAMSRPRLQARVYILHLPGATADSERSDLYNAAAAIPGVEVVIDADGSTMRHFSAAVSGETHLYGGDGRRQFRGGLTAARGHEGDNDGRRAVLALLANERSAVPSTPVFGCYLFESSTRS